MIDQIHNLNPRIEAMIQWHKRHNIDPDPIAAYMVSGYESRAAGERQAIRAAGTGAGSSYAQKAGNRPGNRAYAIMSLSS